MKPAVAVCRFLMQAAFLLPAACAPIGTQYPKHTHAPMRKFAKKARKRGPPVLRTPTGEQYMRLPQGLWRGPGGKLYKLVVTQDASGTGKPGIQMVEVPQTGASPAPPPAPATQPAQKPWWEQ